jgi:hypothetical protein
MAAPPPPRLPRRLRPDRAAVFLQRGSADLLNFQFPEGFERSAALQGVFPSGFLETAGQRGRFPSGWTQGVVVFAISFGAFGNRRSTRPLPFGLDACSQGRPACGGPTNVLFVVEPASQGLTPLCGKCGPEKMKPPSLTAGVEQGVSGDRCPDPCPGHGKDPKDPGLAQPSSRPSTRAAASRITSSMPR